MSETVNKHWTRDADLLERFVLHRVDEVERTRLETHLMMCEECQSAVKNEQMLVLGLKRAGQEEMKARLRERLAAAEPQKITVHVPWMRIASVAAVVVILVGLGIYNRWFEKEQLSTSEQLIEPPRERDTSAERRQIEGQRDEARNVPRASELQRRDQALRQSRESPAGEHDVGLQRDAVEAMKLQAPAAAIAGAEKEDTFDAAEGVARQQFWVEGTVVTDPHKQMAAESTPSMVQKAKPVSPTVRVETQSASSPTVTVVERSLDQLPPLRQQRQRALAKQQVQTLVEPYEVGYRFVLYRGSSQKGEVEQTAVLRKISEDSVVVILGNEQIGYRLPPMLSRHLQQRSKER
ncbi:MAG TPA: zf-HC2 domain-containing protein [Bacteroidota bacterium]|nr:zf-HC2 domain-containing protein [Bacteroidota bacterium]